MNETLAKRLFPTLDPPQVLGQSIRIGMAPRRDDCEVVGVAANVRSRRPDAPPDPEVYVPFEQNPAPSMTFVVRAQGDPRCVVESDPIGDGADHAVRRARRRCGRSTRW